MLLTIGNMDYTHIDAPSHSSLPTFPITQEDRGSTPHNTQFFSDIFDSAMGTPVGFLERYPEVEDYQQVIHSLDLASHLSSLVVLGNNEEIL